MRGILALVALAACGRTSLDTVAPRDAANEPEPTCAAPDTSAPFAISSDVQSFGNVAGSGCSFAAAWLENRDGHLFVVGATLRVANGAWRASNLVTFASLGIDYTLTTIAWDGSAYSVAWKQNDRIVVGRMSMEGEQVGSPRTLVETGSNAAVVWLDAAKDPPLVGMIDDGIWLVHGHSKAQIVPTSFDPEVVGFVHGESTRVVWLDRQVPRVHIEHFDDSGQRLDLTPPFIVADATQSSRYGVASTPAGTYIGLSDNGLFVGRLREEGGFDPVKGVHAGDRPVLASTDDGTIGVLAAEHDFQSDLHLSVVRGLAAVETRVVEGGQGQSYGYGLAGGARSFGMAWDARGTVKLAVYTP